MTGAELLRLDDEAFVAAMRRLTPADQREIDRSLIESASCRLRYDRLTGYAHEVRDMSERAPRAKRKPKNGAAVDIPLPEGETALELVERDIPEPRRRCNPWGTEGLNLIASRPKLGKTTLIRQKLAAFGVGGEFLGAPCEMTPSAFLSLEEGPRLMRSKFKRAGFPEEALAAIRIFYEWPRGSEGVEQLGRLLTEKSHIGYVAIDTLSRFRAVPDSRTPAFIADYEAMSMLHRLTTSHPGLVVDVAHHTRKMRSEDPIDDISGTYGLSAACDSYCVLRWHEDGAVMHVGGRLWERDVSDYKLRRANQRWELAGEHTGLTAEQERTLELVRSSGGIGGQVLADRLGIGKQSAWDRLESLVAKGVAFKKEGVVYAKC